MGLCKDEAIVLFKRAYGESDRIVRFFTLRSGKIAAIAKGGNKSQKRFMNTLEPFNHIIVEYFEKQGKGLVRVENADIVETNHGIETSLKRACVAGFFTELVDGLTREREGHERLFHILREIIVLLKGQEFRFTEILLHHLKILEALGFMPNLNACVYCGRPMEGDKRLFFSRERGGVLCASCSSALPHRTYPDGVIDGILCMNNSREGLVNEERPYGYETFEEKVQDLMEGFMAYHLDVRFKSYRLMKEIVFRR